MNTDVRKKAKNGFEKDFFKLMNNAVLGKMMKIVRKYRDAKLATTERRRNDLVSGPNYHTENFFTESILATKVKKKQKSFSLVAHRCQPKKKKKITKIKTNKVNEN